jgi:hypothetical protein
VDGRRYSKELTHIIMDSAGEVHKLMTQGRVTVQVQKLFADRIPSLFKEVSLFPLRPSTD